MTADLKPCPFCGCTTIKRVDQDEDIAWYECAWCQVAGPVEGVDDDGQPQGWNTRAPTVSDTGADRDAALAQVSAWQPIATAPRDGTIVDLWGINHLHYAKRQERICNVHYGPVTDWMGHERNDWRHGRCEDFEPTHWMPLPAPPVDSSAAQATAVDDSTGADPVGKEG